MFIESLKVSYPTEGWSLEETKFDRFNLLVGASGVGKTRILRAILDLRRIATGGSFKDAYARHGQFEWEVGFRTIGTGPLFKWTGIFLEVENSRGESEYRFPKEELSEGGMVFLSRIEGKVLFEDKPTLKLRADEGLISILKEEDRIKPLFESFSRITEGNQETFGQKIYGELNLDIYQDWKSLKDSNESLRFKLWWAFNNKGKCDAFELLSTRFLDIFPNFTCFSMTVWEWPMPGKEGSTKWLQIELAESGTESKLDYEDLASGMQRTLDFLGQVHFLPDNSVVLVDEFENSLGVNCLSSVTDLVMHDRRDIQFVLTSHHPYIINNIDMRHWKVVTRKGGTVTTTPAVEFGLGRSRQENFFQLINLEAFQTGVLQEK
jgi:hypothetical protein